MRWQTEQVKSHKHEDYQEAKATMVVDVVLYGNSTHSTGQQVLGIKEVDAGNTMANTPKEKQKAILSKYLRYVVLVVSLAMAFKV